MISYCNGGLYMKYKEVVDNLNILKLDKIAECLSEYVDKVNNEKIPFYIRFISIFPTKETLKRFIIKLIGKKNIEKVLKKKVNNNSWD